MFIAYIMIQVNIKNTYIWKPFDRALSEESPSSAGQKCRITSGEGNFKESATENKPPKGKDETVR